MLNQSSDKLELIRIAEAVASEKAIDKELILSSMESGIGKAANSKYGLENEIKVVIDRLTGNINIFRVFPTALWILYPDYSHGPRPAGLF